MKSMKTVSLILVASTLIPVSAHAWSWSELASTLAKPVMVSAGIYASLTLLSAYCQYQLDEHGFKLKNYGTKLTSATANLQKDVLEVKHNLLKKKYESVKCFPATVDKIWQLKLDDLQQREEAYTHKGRRAAEKCLRYEQASENTQIMSYVLPTAYLLGCLGAHGYTAATNYFSNR